MKDFCTNINKHSNDGFTFVSLEHKALLCLCWVMQSRADHRGDSMVLLQVEILLYIIFLIRDV